MPRFELREAATTSQDRTKLRAESNVSSRFISFLAAVLLLGVAAGVAFSALRHHWAPDLAAIYFGASAYAAGELQSVYASPSVFFGALIEDPVWISLAESQGLAGKPLVSFVYPPLVAAIFAPLTETISAVEFLEKGVALELVCLCLSVFLARSLAANRLPAAHWALASLIIGLPTIAVQNAFFHAQPQIIIISMILLAFVLYRKRWDVPAGLVLAIAGSIKLAPLLLGIVFLADRRWRAAAATALGAAAFAIVGTAVTGPEMQLAFFAQIQRAGGSHLLSPLSYSAAGILTAAWGIVSGTPAELLSDKSFMRMETVAWITGLSYLLLFCGSLLILAKTRKLAFADALPLRLIGIWSLLSVFGPLGWAHYAVGPILLLPTVLCLYPRRQALLLLLPIVVGLSLPTSLIVIWLAPGISLGSVAAIQSLLVMPVAFMAGTGQKRLGDDADGD